MNKPIIRSLLLVFLLGACTRSVAPSPIPTQPPPVLPSPTIPPTEPPPPTAQPTSEVVIATLTPTEEVVPPSPTPVPPTPLPPTATSPPTQAPTATRSPTEAPFDAVAFYGTAKFRDPMTSSSEINWVGESGILPNTDNIRLQLKNNQLYVTGKRTFFDTWWFSWPLADDFYLQMDVETETCAGKDAYGVILRGPLRGTGFTYGYVVVFSCDGSYQVKRIDGTDPYQEVTLIDWTESRHIAAGSNQTNRLGVRAVGRKLVIYANDKKVDQVVDSNYTEGRYGVFVSANLTPNFTFRVDEMAYWELE